MMDRRTSMLTSLTGSRSNMPQTELSTGHSSWTLRVKSPMGLLVA